MLVLTRKQGEKIQIGDDVIITVVRTKGKAVRLGIQAPAHVPVLRGEILASIQNETQRHAGDSHDELGADDDGEPAATGGVATAVAIAPSATLRSQAILRQFIDARGV